MFVDTNEMLRRSDAASAAFIENIQERVDIKINEQSGLMLKAAFKAGWLTGFHAGAATVHSDVKIQA